MENMKSLADQLREELIKPNNKNNKTGHTEKKAKEGWKEPAILAAIIAYDNSQNKTMGHIRFDEKTMNLMNRFKMATGVDVTKLVAFSVKHLFETHPELKMIIKQFIQNTEL
jgi:hypothetical protein